MASRKDSFRVSSAAAKPAAAEAPASSGEEAPKLEEPENPPEAAIARSEAPKAEAAKPLAWRVEAPARIFYRGQLIVLSAGQTLRVQHFGPEKIEAFITAGAKLTPLE